MKRTRYYSPSHAGRTVSLNNGLRNFFTHFFALFLIFGAHHAASAAAPKDLLQVSEAFQLHGEAIAEDLVRVEWEIADGYYLYKERFRFTSDTPGVRFGEPIFPTGKFKTDEFFGEMEIYRDKVSVDIPLILTKGTVADRITVKTVSQGCADIGVCYPPHRQSISFDSMPQQAGIRNSGFLETLSSFGSKFGFGNNDSTDFLQSDQAFILSVDALDGNTLSARWDIADGYYLYREKFGFAVTDGQGVAIGEPQSPPGEFKDDETFGRMEVYHDGVSITLPMLRETLSATNISLEVRYQGCAEAGFCYPPIKKLIPVALPIGEPPTGAMTTTPPGGTTEAFVSEQDRFAQTLAGDSLLLIVTAFFGVGLLLAFTPCVFPMVPILSSIVVGQGAQISTRKAFSLSLAYVLAMALTYTGAGIVAGMSGENLQAAFQNPWILIVFSLVFVGLALSMFGLYDLQLPASWQGKISTISNRQSGGTLTGSAVMGFLSALIVGPCVAAPLAGALIYIGQTGDATLGGVALFALSMGMGTPLLLVGTSAGKLLPKVGPWMDKVKAFFGIMLLGVAIWMLERIVSPQIAMLLWAGLVIFCAFYLGVFRRFNAQVSRWRKLGQGTGMLLLTYGVVLVVGAATGGKDIFNPLSNLSVASSTDGTALHTEELTFQTVKGLEGLNAELARAGSQKQAVMLDFYADWCVSCKEMEKYTFSDPQVHQILENVALLQTDVTANDEIDQALMKQFGLFGPPSILFFGADGEERSQFRVVGFMDAKQFRDHAERALR